MPKKYKECKKQNIIPIHPLYITHVAQPPQSHSLQRIIYAFPFSIFWILIYQIGNQRAMRECRNFVDAVWPTFCWANSHRRQQTANNKQITNRLANKSANYQMPKRLMSINDLTSCLGDRGAGKYIKC